MLAFLILAAWMLSSLIEVAILLGVAYLGILLFRMIRATGSSQT